jgi:regulator of sigma E protease
MGSGFLFQLGAVALLLGGLIFIHELGHFLVAKAFGVKVLRFSLGFGPRILGFTRGETDYRISLLPLGGYVKMAGDDPSEELAPEDRGRGFLEQKPWKRILIAFAGPGMNLLFPLLAYFVLFAGQREAIGAYVGKLYPEMPGYAAGLRPGDKIVEIDGEKVFTFSDLMRAVAPNPGKRLRFTVDRAGKEVSFDVTPERYADVDPIETQMVGKIGMMPQSDAPWLGLAAPEGPLHAAGLRSLDRIVSVGGEKPRTQEDAYSLLAAAAAAGKPFEVVATREEQVEGGGLALFVPRALTVTVDPAGGAPLALTGTDLMLTWVDPGSAAALAGLRRGDRLSSLDGKPLTSWRMVENTLIEKKATPFALAFVRDGAEQLVTLTQDAKEIVDPIRDQKITSYSLGAFSKVPLVAGPVVAVPFRPLLAAQMAAGASWEVGRKILLGIGKIFSGDIAFKNVGGPGEIFQITRRAVEQGWEVYLHTMAMISINLGLINLFPVPVLDGGHIVQATIEAVRRRPLSLRAREVSNLVGLVLLLTLMVFVIKNDVVRYLLPG